MLKKFGISILIFIGVVLIIINIFRQLRLHAAEDTLLQLPQFEDYQQLRQSKWFSYFKLVYHSPPKPENLPINLNNFAVFDINKLHQSKIYLDLHILPVPLCPIRKNQLYENMSIDWDPSSTTWLSKNSYFQTAPSHTWVEVTHSGNIISQDTLNEGNWLYEAKGSGIFFYTGKTIIFKDHTPAVRYFLHQACTWPDHRVKKNECINEMPKVFIAARKQGYDSVQFYDQDDQRCGSSAVEIVDLKGNSNYACGDAKPNSDVYFKRYRTGFNHELPCLCKPNLSNPYQGSLNCDLSH